MNQETEFAAALQNVRQTAKEQHNVISREQVQNAFAQLGLAGEQLDLVFDYLKKHKVGIGEPVDPQEYLSEEDVTYLDAYLEQLKTQDTPSDGELEAVALSAMAGDGAAKQKLIELFLPQVAEVAKLYAGQGALMEDLIGEGNLALAMGVEMLGCLEHGSEAQGMLVRMMMDAMEEHIAENVQEAEIDSEVVKRVNEVNDKARTLAEGLLRKVTVQELEEETGMSGEQIREAVRMSGRLIAYIQPGEEN